MRDAANLQPRLFHGFSSEAGYLEHQQLDRALRDPAPRKLGKLLGTLAKRVLHSAHLCCTLTESLMRRPNGHEAQLASTEIGAKNSCIKSDSVEQHSRMPNTKRSPSTAHKAFWIKLRAARHQQTVTQEDLANMIWSYITSVGRGERNIGIGNMNTLADGPRLDLPELLTPKE